MSAMKKTTTKTKSPAPATSTTKPSRKKSSAASKGAATTAPAPVPTPAAPAGGLNPAVTINQTASDFVPAVRAVVSTPVQTRIVARVDVGFGNTLYLRGDGPGLSWSQGVPMDCVAGDQWEYTLGESARPVSFKVLINDTTWCAGPDSVAASGSTTTITPEFL